MNRESIYETFKNILWEKKCPTTVSCDYANHHQILCAILEDKGEKNYPTDRKGTIFGFRSKFVTTSEGDVVIVVHEPLDDGEL